MDAGNLIFLLLILACPLMMIFMMRGHGHGDGGQGGDTAHAGHEPATSSLDDLKRRRSALDDEIASRESRQGSDDGARDAET